MKRVNKSRYCSELCFYQDSQKECINPLNHFNLLNMDHVYIGNVDFFSIYICS